MSCHTFFYLGRIIVKDFCVITTRNELADFLKIKRKNLTYLLYIKKIENCYTSFEIPKKSGGSRRINAPRDELKEIQKKLADALWEKQKSIWKDKNIHPNISHAFEKQKGIITNAKIHRNKRFVLNIDLKDFFNSFHFGRVRGFFEKNRDFQLPTKVATIIAQLACYNGRLPQGAPSSPIITNLICQILDIRLLKISKKYKLDYTRYADDLTFSTNNKSFLDNQEAFCAEISEEVKKAGFSINTKKTRLQFRDSKQTVTGLVVNKKLSVDRAYCRKTRAMAHKLYSTGEFEIDGQFGNIRQLEGRFAFIHQLDWYNNDSDDFFKHNAEDKNRKKNRQGDEIRTFWTLNTREKQYKKFLFYKYFFSNDKPLIVTEGKTDPIYLKAALKNLHADYPNLIVKKPDGNFDFKISFFKRTKRTNYFLCITEGGASSMTNLYNYFSEKGTKGNFPNYLKYFCKLSHPKGNDVSNKTGTRLPKNPVILLFDNEKKPRPLENFTDYVGFKDDKLKLLDDKLKVKLVDDGNLFLATNPLVDGKTECEIEDLFAEEVLNHKLDGKTFSRKDDDTNTTYGKHIFSQYISANYREIDFSNFRSILDNFNEIIESYQKVNKERK